MGLTLLENWTPHTIKSYRAVVLTVAKYEPKPSHIGLLDHYLSRPSQKGSFQAKAVAGF